MNLLRKTDLPVKAKHRPDIRKAKSLCCMLAPALMMWLMPGGAVQAQAVDLRAVYESARSYDAEFQAAFHDLEAARLGVPVARSAFMPQLNLSGQAGLNSESDDRTGSIERGQASVQLRQTIFNRNNSKLLKQAKLAVLQAEAQYAALEQSLILRTSTAYFDVLRAQANVEFSQSELQAISRQREQAERRFDVGLVPITDVRSAQAQYDLAVAQEIEASDQFAAAREALRRISGLDADLLTPLAADLPLEPPEPADIDSWVATALDQNLELVIARLATENQANQVSIERSRRFPTLDLVGSATSSRTKITGLPDREGESAVMNLELNVPIITGGQVNAQVARAKATLSSTQAQQQSQERTTIQQTRDGYRGVRASIARARALRQALVSTQQSADAAEAGFRAGTRTSVEVLQELRDTFRARSDFAGARYDYIINMFNLKAASGTLTVADIEWINQFLAFPE